MATRYIDMSATNNGDGTTAAQAGSPGGVGAYNTLVGATVTASDTVWIRRAGTLTLAATFTFSVNSVSYIGWPITTDEDYSGRPASGTSNGWDADSSAAIATISHNYTTSTFQILITATTPTFKRLKFNQTGTGAGAATVYPWSTSTTYVFKYMTIISAAISTFAMITWSGTLNCSACTFNVVAQASAILPTTPASGQFYDCTFTNTNGVANTIIGVIQLTTTGSCEFIRCTSNVTGGVACAVLGIATSSPTLPHVFVDCIFDNSTAASSTGNHLIDSITVNILFRNCKAKGSEVNISGVTSTLSQHFSEITQTWPTLTNLLSVSSIPFLVCDNLTALFGNTSADLLAGLRTVVLLNNANFSNPTLPISSSQSSPGIFISSYNGIPGNFYFFGIGGTISSTNVTRSGGSALSFKFECLNNWGPVNELNLIPGIIPLSLGIPGVLDPINIALSSGTRTITVYGYYKNGQTTPTSDEIWMELEYLDLASPTRTVLTTKARGALTSDTSTWTGEDSKITKFKLVIASLSVSSTTNGVVRLSKKMWDPGSYVVFDSAPVVT